MEIQKDILQREPRIGSLICYNPPRYKGLVSGKVIGFTKAGLPLTIDLTELADFEESLEEGLHSLHELEKMYTYAPRTGYGILIY